jgi:hypothetical protein
MAKDIKPVPVTDEEDAEAALRVYINSKAMRTQLDERIESYRLGLMQWVEENGTVDDDGHTWIDVPAREHGVPDKSTRSASSLTSMSRPSLVYYSNRTSTPTSSMTTPTHQHSYQESRHENISSIAQSIRRIRSSGSGDAGD